MSLISKSNYKNTKHLKSNPQIQYLVHFRNLVNLPNQKQELINLNTKCENFDKLSRFIDKNTLWEQKF